MKKVNLIYIAAIIVGLILWRIAEGFNANSLVFYGFAETKETEINSEFPVEIIKIHVTPGQKVSAGDLLAEVNQSDLPKKQVEAGFKIEELRAEKVESRAQLQASISRLEAQKIMKTGDIDSKILELKAKAEQNRRLLKDIGSNSSEKGLTEIKIETLEKEKSLIIKPLNVQINELKKQLKLIGEPKDAQIRNLENEIEFFGNKAKKLSISAPTDGLIGNIHIKEAENVPSFRTLITFYEENPTLVSGFIHESMILQVSVGDTLEVQSILNERAQCKGVVTGLGSRIVEIPSRLRKLEEIKTYGREILIQIPPENDFLQKEKVILKLDPSKTPTKSAWQILTGSAMSSPIQAQNHH